MADRYDPKVTVRPATDRKGPDAHQSAASNDDPLFELARIVSGRGAGAGVPAPAPSPVRSSRPAPAPEPPRPPAGEPNVLDDLEAELLSDLQASFSAVKEAIEPKHAEPPPVAPQPSPPPAAAAPPAAAMPPPAAPPPPAPSAPPPEASAAKPATAPEPSPPPPSAPAPHSVLSRLSAAARPPLQQMQPRQPPAAAPPPTARERPPAPPPATAAPTTPAAPKKVEVGNLNLRPTAAPHVRVSAAPPVNPPSPPEAPAPTAARSRWEKPAEPPKPQASIASRFAPPRAGGPAHAAPSQPAPPPAADDEDLPFGEGVPFAPDGEEASDEFPLDAFDIVPGYGDDAEVPPYPEDDDIEPLRRRGVPRSLVAVAGILALVLIGVLGFIMLRPAVSGGGEPPIITADAGPTKIAPPEAPATGNNDQNKLIYDRVNSGSTNGPADTNLVTPGNQPIAPVPSNDDSNSPIARVILPGGPEGPAPADAGNAGDNSADVATGEGDGAQSIGPRKVRTVVVRPDGTIVSSDAAPAEGDAPASDDATATPMTPTAETPQAPAAPAVPAAPTDDDTAAIAGGQSGHELPITTNPEPSAGPAAPETPAPPAKTATKTPTPAPTPKPAQPKVVASGGGNGPLDLTPGNGKATTQVASRTADGGGGALPLASSGMMVQVSSQRSEDAARATFRDLQARYPSILGRYDINIQRADLGDRGTYYRVRVGPFASANAQSLCSQLKNAGGDCILSPH